MVLAPQQCVGGWKPSKPEGYQVSLERLMEVLAKLLFSLVGLVAFRCKLKRMDCF